VPVRVQTEDFDISADIRALRAGRSDVGAVASFIGVMRDFNDGSGVTELTLEHYPGMTEKSLQQIARSSGKTVAQVVLRWAVQKGVVAIPGTSNPAHMDENLAGVYSFALSTEQMGIIDAVRSDPKAKGFTAMGFEKNES
jgi:hypothetical protein